jgi:hypothetical protein
MMKEFYNLDFRSNPASKNRKSFQLELNDRDFEGNQVSGGSVWQNKQTLSFTPILLKPFTTGYISIFF